MCDVTRSSPSRPSQIDGDLRAPVGVDRAEVGQRAGLDELAEFGGKRGHRLDTVRWRGCSCAPRTRWRPSSGRRTRRRGRRSPSSSRTRRPPSGRRSTAASPTRVASCRRCTGSRRRPRRCCTPCTRTSRSSPGRSRVRRSTRSTCASACRGVELEPGSDVLRDLYQQLLPGRLRGALGEFLTPPWLAEACLRRLEETGAPLASGRVLDPTCGTGTFLLRRARPPARRAAGLGRGHAAVACRPSWTRSRATTSTPSRCWRRGRTWSSRSVTSPRSGSSRCRSTARTRRATRRRGPSTSSSATRPGSAGAS